MTQIADAASSELDTVQVELAATLNEISLLDAALVECAEITKLYFDQ